MGLSEAIADVNKALAEGRDSPELPQDEIEVEALLASAEAMDVAARALSKILGIGQTAIVNNLTREAAYLRGLALDARIASRSRLSSVEASALYAEDRAIRGSVSDADGALADDVDSVVHVRDLEFGIELDPIFGMIGRGMAGRNGGVGMNLEGLSNFDAGGR